MTTITKEQVDAAIKELDMAAGIADTFHARNCFAALDNVKAYIAQLEERVKVLEKAGQDVVDRWNTPYAATTVYELSFALAGGKEGV